MSTRLPAPYTQELLALCVKFLEAPDEDDRRQAFYELGDMFLESIDDPCLLDVPEWAHQLARRAHMARVNFDREIERVSREVVRRAVGMGLVKRAPCTCPDCTPRKAAN